MLSFWDWLPTPWAPEETEWMMSIDPAVGLYLEKKLGDRGESAVKSLPDPLERRETAAEAPRLLSKTGIRSEATAVRTGTGR